MDPVESYSPRSEPYTAVFFSISLLALNPGRLRRLNARPSARFKWYDDWDALRRAKEKESARGGGGPVSEIRNKRNRAVTQSFQQVEGSRNIIFLLLSFFLLEHFQIPFPGRKVKEKRVFIIIFFFFYLSSSIKKIQNKKSRRLCDDQMRNCISSEKKRIQAEPQQWQYTLSRAPWVIFLSIKKERFLLRSSIHLRHRLFIVSCAAEPQGPRPARSLTI